MELSSLRPHKARRMVCLPSIFHKVDLEPLELERLGDQAYGCDMERVLA